MSEDIKETGIDEYPDIAEALQQDWNIFNVSSESLLDYLNELFLEEYGEFNQLFDSQVIIESQLSGEDEENNIFYRESWIEFCNEFKFNNRFFPKKNFNLSDLELIINKHANFWTGLFFRGRFCEVENKVISPEKMGKPPINKAKAGRANPPGISYLYLCSDQETCAFEIRAKESDNITIGKFYIRDSINLVDLNSDMFSPFATGEEFPQVYRFINVLYMLSKELSKLVEPDNDIVDYLPTQYLCEWIKNLGFDGIRYNSSRGKGSNYVIFKDEKLVCLESYLYKVSGENKLEEEKKGR